jgi:PqqD family protein of HPr-rel-A system
LLVRSIGDETIVYDRATHRAHCLNDVARFVLDRCDGETPANEIADALRDQGKAMGPADAAEVVEAALEELGQAGLIENSPAAESTRSAIPRSRRATLHALGAACLTPLVLSLSAPTPAEAQTCRDRPCTSSRQCCPDAPCCRSQGPNNPTTCRPGSVSNPNCLP